MKYIPSIAFEEMSGSAKGVTAAKTRGRKYIRNLYMRLNYWIVFCGGDALANPPELVGVEAPGEAVISLTAEKFTFELEQVPAAAADLRLVVCASAPQGNGITRAYSKAAVIGGPFAVEATEIDIKAAYESKNGAPTAAAPKVFMKYFFVNTKTGEKSGEMMAIARL